MVVEFERPARRARGGETDGERLLGALELRLGVVSRCSSNLNPVGDLLSGVAGDGAGKQGR